MIGKLLFYLVIFAGSLLGLPASAVTTSKNVDIIVTHGAPLTTFTFVNNTGATLPAGTPVSMGQAFRYGDVMPGTYPLIRDATTHVALPGQQWDEISTWCFPSASNCQTGAPGFNGSWRHAVWAIWLPNSLAAGASYQIEFVPTAGTYSETSHQALSSLCSGPGAHDFKIHLADVRNQDDTVRDSGDATFRLCDNIANTGRDAPRHLRAGNVYDEYQVSGLFTYATSGHQDPLLYVRCDVDLFTDAADGKSLKDVRHVCTTFNSWMNVASGSAGNSGNSGPAGFGPSTGGGAAGDPQVISYRPQILDGTTDILDWTGLNATISSANNPINPNGCSSSGTYQGTLSMNVPSSAGVNTWFEGMAVRVSTTGTAVGGLTPGKLYWVYNCGTTGTGGSDTQSVQLLAVPTVYQKFGTILTNSQGTGTTSFTQVFWHPHWLSWQDEDTTADQSWATRGSTARFTRRIYPALTSAERSYWEQTGLIEPLNLSQTSSITVPWSHELTLLYNPFSKGNVIGTTGTGERPDLGFANEWSNQAFVSQVQHDWFLSRLFAMGSQTHGWSTLLDESTGRIPVLNNGPPTGPAGNGVGGSYGTGTNSAIALGAPQNQTTWDTPFFTGVISPNPNIPNGNVDWRCIWVGCGTYISHVPNFVSYNYWIFGERLFLDSLYFAANRDLLQRQAGPGPFGGTGDAQRDDVEGGNHYWGLTIACCQARGSAWGLRDRTFAAASGGDGNVERQYFNDQITENMNYYTAWLAYKQGPTGTQISTSELIPDYAGSWSIPDTYIGAYIFTTVYGMQSFLHAVTPAQWIVPFQRFYEAVCGGTSPPPFYCIDFTLSMSIANGDHISTTGAIGPYINGTDSSNFGNQQNGTNVLSGGVLQYASSGYYTFTNGDTIQLINGLYYGNMLIDQLPGNRKFPIMNVNNSNSTYQIQCNAADHAAFPRQCPTAGGPFTDLTRGGMSIAGETQDLLIYRLQYNPGPGIGYADNNYTKYGGTVMNGLRVLGYDAPDARAAFVTQGGATFYNPSYPGWNWDSTVVVPGSP